MSNGLVLHMDGNGVNQETQAAGDLHAELETLTAALEAGRTRPSLH